MILVPLANYVDMWMPIWPTVIFWNYYEHVYVKLISHSVGVRENSNIDHDLESTDYLKTMK